MDVTLYGKNLYKCDLVQDLEMGKVPSIIWVDPKCHHKYLYKREAERFHTDGREGDGTMEKAETGWMMQPQAKERWQHQQLEEAGTNSPLESPQGAQLW